MKKPLCFVGVTMVVSCLLACVLTKPLQITVAIFAVFCCVIAIFILKTKLRPVVIVVTLTVVLSFCLFMGKEAFIFSEITKLDGEVSEIVAVVTDYSCDENGKYKYNLQVEQVLSNTECTAQNFKTVMYSDEDIGADFYQKAKLKVSFFAPTNYSDFDSISYYKGRDIFVLSRAVDYYNSTLYEVDKGIFYYIKSFNQHINEKAKLYLEDEDVLSVFEAMVMGDTSDISPVLKQNYVDAGVFHLFAVSGIHVFIVSIIALFCLKAFRLNKRTKAIVKMILVWGFIIFTGCRISSIRAGIMLSILVLDDIFYRKSNNFNNLCICAIIIVLDNVYVVRDIGFLMSFLSCAGIILCASRVQLFLCGKSKNRLVKSVMGLVSVSLCANAFLLPVYLSTYGYVSIIAVVSNLAVTLTSFLILLLGIVFTMVGSVNFTEVAVKLIAEILDSVIKLQNKIVGILADVPYATVGIDYNIIKSAIVLACLLVVVACFYRKRQNFVKLSVVIAVNLVVVGFCVNALCYHNTVRVYSVSDGQVSNVILCDNKDAVIISTSNDDYIDQKTVQFLKSKAIYDVKSLILCYNDSWYYESIAPFSFVKDSFADYHSVMERVLRYNYLKRYEDSSVLLDTVEVKTLFYNKCNSTLYSFLCEDNATKDMMYKLENDMILSDNIRLCPSYYKQTLSLDLIVADKKLRFSNYIPSFEKGVDMAFIFGNIYSFVDDIDCEEVYVMQKQYEKVMSEVYYKNLFDENIEKIIRLE